MYNLINCKTKLYRIYSFKIFIKPRALYNTSLWNIYRIYQQINIETLFFRLATTEFCKSFKVLCEIHLLMVSFSAFLFPDFPGNPPASAGDTVRAQEDFTGLGATKPMHHNFRA